MYSISPTSMGKNITGESTVLTNHPDTKGVFIGAAGDYDFYMRNDPTDETSYGWVTFTGCVAGSVLPIKVRGVRNNSDSASPSSNAIVFLYY